MTFNKTNNYLRMKFIKLLVVWTIVLLQSNLSIGRVKEIDLSGKWTVVLDSLNIGLNQNWAKQKLDGSTIFLPGTLDSAGLGKLNTQKPAMDNSIMWGLTRKYQYIGVAWFQREINIPANWSKQKIALELERVIWQSQVFIDGNLIGTSESLTTPHRYNLDAIITPGKHTITIKIDNSNLFPLINFEGDRYPDPINQDMSHAYTNHTQTKWNGVIGKIKLVATTNNQINNLQVYSNVDKGTITATFNRNKGTKGKLLYEISNLSGKILAKGKIDPNQEQIEVVKPSELALWDEFYPNLYDFKIISGKETTVVRFGYRKIHQKEATLMLNENRIFLRGNLECASFPLTGHPPMTKKEWDTIILQAKAYGLNHIRFHSWCPPKAAFEAADEAGLYLQIELPHWSLKVGKDEKTTEFLLSEADKILREYGNHASFVMMSLGNELEGDVKLLNNIVAALRKKDNRHLYTTTTFSFQFPLGYIAQPEDDFLITQKTDKGWIRGQGVFNQNSPKFNQDFSANSNHVPVPLISHEIGQYAVFPDLTEIKKYTGVQMPLNFIAVKNELEKKGLLNKAADYTYASGKLAAMLYKEEIERALKTPSFDGFQLLQLQDFPGQGTALVGLLNVFWESKGIISAKEFKEFNAEVVPLLNFEKAVYQNGEQFKAFIEVANFYKSLKNQTIKWSITNQAGVLLKEGILNNIDLAIGNNKNLGEISYPVMVDKAEKLMLKVALTDTNYKNSWPIWVYPKNTKTNSDVVFITQSITEAKEQLEKGKTVLFNPPHESLIGTAGRFVPVFWSPVHFPERPNTMGLLLNEKHAAFNDFPTHSYTEWQWWDLCMKSKAIDIDSINVTPIVTVIDGFVTNRKLATVFEAQVGKGKLIFTSIDLQNDLENRPVARQLRASLLQYMESNAFSPTKTIEFEKLNFFEPKKDK